VRILRRRLPPHADADALLSDASVGLLRALRQFDPSRRVPFRAFAIRCMRSAMLDGLRQRDWAPRGARRVAPPPQFHPLCSSLPAPAGNNRIEMRDALHKALRCLPRRDRLVLQLSFLEEMPLKQIGRCFGLSEAAISIIRRNAVNRAREVSREDGLKFEV
jgi:RNA polymerase sigma factor (sigma-70 family)